MQNLCVSINNAYSSFLKYLYIPLKRKYIIFLNKLYVLNLLTYEICSKHVIKINLRYYNNKPLFYLRNISTFGRKLYLKNYQIRNKLFFSCSDIYLYTTNFGILCTNDFVKAIGGKEILKIELLGKNIIT